MSAKTNHHPTTGIRLAVFAAVVVIVLALNAIVRPAVCRVDLTEDRLYTLSDGTRAILASLKQPVTLKLYFSESDPQIPVGLKNFARQVEELLQEYAQAGEGKILLEKYDPEPDSDAEDWARRYGVAGQSLGPVGPMLYLGLVAVSGSRESVIPLIDPQQEELLEYHIDRLITGVIEKTKPVIGVISSLPVLPPPVKNPYAREEQGWVAFQDLKEQFTLEPVDPSATEIPKHVETLIVVQPTELADSVVRAIDQFVMRGGRLMAFMDPLCFADMNEASAMNPAAGGTALQPLLEAWGVTYDPQEVVADFDAATTVQSGGGRVESNPTWITLNNSSLNATNLITARMESMLFPAAGSFTVKPDEKHSVAALASTSPRSLAVPVMMARMGDAPALRSQYKKEAGKARDVIVQLRGNFRSAFPQAASTNGTDTAWMNESAGETVITLVGDVDLLADAFAVRAFNFFGQTGYQPINDNITFLLNTAETLTGNRNLMDVRTRARMERPFTVVQDLLRQAQDRFLQKEQDLQQQLTLTEERLRELESRKDEAQQFILSPQQKQEIESFRKQEYETRKQLKLVRRNLRRDIESLGVHVKFINIALMPLAVGAAGIGFWQYRRRKMKQAQ